MNNSRKINIYTIGFTKKNAEIFFKLIKESNTSTVIDVRLNNVSQLSGFAKRDDLKYFLQELCLCGYVHEPQLSPTKEILSAYKKGDISWEKYKFEFEQIMAKRLVEKIFTLSQLKNSCLLCSEHDPEFCHRRLVAEYLQENIDSDIVINHLY